jgi:hypothetical protein
MATWKITPTWKKSVVERQCWTKGEDTVEYEIGWRWGEFFIESENEPIELKEGDFDIMNCGYELIDFSTDDGCWEESDIMVEDEQEYETTYEFLQENSVYDLEELGWEMSECEMWIQCECDIEEVKE